MADKKYDITKDYYWFLGIADTAGKEEIRRAFRNLSKKYHPDINPDAEKVYMAILEAREILLDSDQRCQYDKERVKSGLQKSRREYDVNRRQSDKAAQARDEKKRREEEEESIRNARKRTAGGSSYNTSNKSGNTNATKDRHGTKSGKESTSAYGEGTARGNYAGTKKENSTSSGSQNRSDRSSGTSGGGGRSETGNSRTDEKKQSFYEKGYGNASQNSRGSTGSSNSDHFDHSSWGKNSSAGRSGTENRSSSGSAGNYQSRKSTESSSRSSRFDYFTWEREGSDRAGAGRENRSSSGSYSGSQSGRTAGGSSRGDRFDYSSWEGEKTSRSGSSGKTFGSTGSNSQRRRTTGNNSGSSERFDYAAWEREWKLKEEKRKAAQERAKAAYEARSRNEQNKASPESDTQSSKDGDKNRERASDETFNADFSNTKSDRSGHTYSADFNESRQSKQTRCSETEGAFENRNSSNAGNSAYNKAWHDPDYKTSYVHSDEEKPHSKGAENPHAGSSDSENAGKEGPAAPDSSTKGAERKTSGETNKDSGNEEGNSRGRTGWGARSTPRTGFVFNGNPQNRTGWGTRCKSRTGFVVNETFEDQKTGDGTYQAKNGNSETRTGSSSSEKRGGDKAKSTRFDYEAWERERNSRAEKRKAENAYGPGAAGAAGGDRREAGSSTENSHAENKRTESRRSENASGSESRFSQGRKSDNAKEFEKQRGAEGRTDGSYRSAQPPVRGQDIEVTLSVTVEDLLSAPVTRRLTLPRDAARRFIDVNLPCGVRNGSRLKVTGMGGAGRHGGRNGDLYITICLPESSNYRIEEDNLIIFQDIAPWDAALGCVVLNMSIPDFNLARYMTPSVLAFPGTQTGTRQGRHGKGKGLPRRDGTLGDIIIEFRVVMPAFVSSSEKELWMKMRELHPDKNRTSIEAFTAAFEETSAKYRKDGH